MENQQHREFFEAVRSNDLDRTLDLLQSTPGLANARILGDATLLNEQIWLERKSVDVHVGETRDTPALHYAVFHGHVEMAAMLLEHGADVHALGYEHWHEMTPAIVLAAWQGEIEMLRLLLEKGADPNAQSANGFSPLATALRAEKIDQIQLLKNYGAQLENTIATADVRYDRPYYENVYVEWLKHRSKYRQYEASIALGIFLWGIAIAARFPHQWLVGALITCYGTYNLFMAVTHKRRWVNDRIATVRDNKSVDLWFDSETVTSVSMNGCSSMRLDGFIGFTPASEGFFLIPDTGVSIYVPRAAIEPCSSYPKLIELLSETAEQAKMRVEEN